jgi:hypothetical protein
VIPQPITCVLLDLTTHCDQRCPNCCCGIGINRTLQHHPWEYFERAAAVLYGVERVHLTGGEPTLHPQFAAFVPRFKQLFGCQRLTLGTDGFRLHLYRDVIAEHIDEVFFSDYELGRAGELVHLGVAVHTYQGGAHAANHVSRSRRGSGGPCDRAFGECVPYSDGKLYGCCVAPGVDGAEGIAPAAGWREAVRLAPLPCASCWFSP